MPLLSVVVCVYNEEENIRPMVEQIDRELAGLDYEIVYVDDGSTDQTLRELLSLKHPRLCIVEFRRNYGQSAALAAGIEHARGEWIVTMDGDLQNDPEDIPKLLRYLDQYDMATGWRQKREDPRLKKISSRIANAIRKRLSGEEIKDSACTLRAFKRECVQNIPVFDGMHRFLPTLVKMEGYRIIEVPVIHHPRKFGESKYNIRNRMLRAFVDLLAVRWMKDRHVRYEIEERG